MRARYAISTFLAVLALLFTAPLIHAQGTGEISGTVRDDQGGVIPGVTVTLRNVGTGVTRTETTSPEGKYRFSALPPGSYEMTAELSGFQTVVISGELVIRIGFEMTRDITMRIGSLSETVTVTGESPLVETRSTEVGGVVSQTQIADLPINSRNYLSLALLMPGTTVDGTRSFFPTVNVGGAVAFNATGNVLDGTINNWVEDGEPRQNLPEDAVMEFKVSNAQFDAEFGLATAGLVQVVTKSGTNDYHGTGFWYFRDKALNAKGVFEDEKPEYRRDQFGGSIGGPIVQDRMHFFFAAERTDVREFYTVNTGLPQFYSAHEGTFEQPFYRNLYVGRFDWQANNENTFFARYAHEDETSTCGGCGGTVATEAGYDQETPRRSIVLGHTWIPGPDRLNDFRFQGAWNGYYIAPTGTEIWKDPGSFPPERINRLRQTFYFPSLTWGSSFDEVGPESRYEFRDTYTMNFVKHTVKVGGHFSYNKYFEENTGDVLGSWTFGTDQFFDPSDPNSLANLTDAALFSSSLPPINTKKPTKYVAFFAQDDWQVRDNLVLNLGIRWERLINCCNEELDPSIFPVEIPLIDVSQRGDKNNFGPRLGLVWDIDGGGKSVLRWGYGVYYGHVRTLGVLDEFRNFQQYSIEITNPSYPDPYQGQDPQDFAVSGPANLTIVDNGYVQPYSQQYTLGFSRQLSRDFAIHLDGIYNFTQRDRKIRDANLPDPVTGIRPYPEFGRFDYYQSTANLKYKALYVKMEKRYSNRNQFLVSYTLAKSDDSLPLYRTFDPRNLSLDWGPSNNDRRHNLVLSGSFLLPADINLGAVYQFRSELPWNAVAGRDLNGDGFSSTNGVTGGADLVPGTTRNSGGRDLNLAAVNSYRAENGLPPVDESQIDSSRISSLDVRVSKRFAVRGESRFEVMGQIFNLLNTENLRSIYGSGGRVSNALSASFGRILDARPKLQAEIAVKFIF
jgi:hypothetical protein